MSAILLSIHPEYAERILSGTKRYEFRKVACNEKVDRIVIYSTCPVMKVVGEAEVTEVLTDSPSAIWGKTFSYSGITKTFFDDYYRGCNRAVAFHLDRAHKFDQPKELSDYGIKTVPQSFVYLRDQ